MIKTFLMMAVVTVGSFGCKKAAVAPSSPAPKEQATKDIPVLEILPGQSWTYRVMVENPKHPQTGQAVSGSFERIRRFLGPMDPGNGQPLADCFEVTAEDTKTLREFVKITPEEVAIVGQASVDARGIQSDLIWLSSPILFFKAGLFAGDVMPLAVLNKDKNLWRAVRVIGREKITVPAGEFDTVRLQMIGKDGPITLRRTYWFAPGTGLIRESKVQEKDNKPIFTETEELVRIER